MVRPKMKVVLIEPEIPFNTGSIGRDLRSSGFRIDLNWPIGFFPRLVFGCAVGDAVLEIREN